LIDDKQVRFSALRGFDGGLHEVAGLRAKTESHGSTLGWRQPADEALISGTRVKLDDLAVTGVTLIKQPRCQLGLAGTGRALKYYVLTVTEQIGDVLIGGGGKGGREPAASDALSVRLGGRHEVEITLVEEQVDESRQGVSHERVIR